MDSIFSFLMQAESSSKGFLSKDVVMYATSLLAGIGLPLVFYIFIKRKERAEEIKDREFKESIKDLLQKIAKES